MKTSITYGLIGFILLLPTAVFSQHDHESTEHFFSTRNISIFESDLGLLRDDYLYQNVLDHIDLQYQTFHSRIEERLNSGEEISDESFLMEYNQLIDDTRLEIDEIRGTPYTGLGNRVADGPCVNMDFETGDLSGWILTRGNVDGSVPYSFVGEFPVGPSAYHQIFAGGFDPVCGIPRVGPLGGGFSTRIGNGTGVGARAARIKQTFLVDVTNYLFTYSYAVVFQSPVGHGLNQQPYFTVRVFDSLGNSVPCGEYSVIADASSAPDYLSTTWGGSTVLYKDWTNVFANLSAYIGQNVTVEFTSGDCSLTGHFGYAYIDASCAFSDIIASSNSICSGDSTLLTAPPGADTYLWNTGEATQSIWAFTGGVYTCTLTPFAGGGCNIVLDITITEYPSPMAQFTPSSIQVCLGDPVVFTDQSTIPAPGSITGYRWDFDDGIVTPVSSGTIIGVPLTSGNYTMPTHTYALAGVYNVQLYVTTVDGCADSVTIPVTVLGLPIVVAGPNQTVCDGAIVSLLGSGAVSYIWDNGVINGVPFTPAVGSITYTVIGTDGNGCVNTDQVDVIVNPLPNVNAGVDIVICEGTATTLNGSGALSYVWDNGVTDGVPFTPAVGTITYQVTGTDVNGCVNTDQVDVNVNPLPVINAGVDQTICDGASVTLSGSGGVSYIWDNGITDGVPFTPSVGTTTYTVTGTDANGCVNTDQVDVTVNPLPIIGAGPDQTVCDGTAITVNGSGGVSYVWNNGLTDGVPFTPIVGSYTYTVTGTDANGCINTDQVDVIVNPLPNITAGMDQTVCEGASVTLNGSGGVSYLWDNGVTDGTPFIPAVGTTTYTITGTGGLGCSNTDQVDVTVNPLPNVSAGPDQQACNGISVMLSGSGAVNYVWNNGVTNGVPFVQGVGTNTYIVTGTDGNGCVSTDQVDVVVLALPAVGAGQDVEICEGTSIALSGVGASSYVWTGGVIDGVPFTPSVGSHTYIVTGTDLNICSNVDTVNVLVNPNPVANAGPDQEGCEGELITLYHEGSGIVTWDNGVINGVPFQQAIGIVIYTLTDSLPTGCIGTDQVRVEIHPLPDVDANDDEICEGEGVTLTGSGALTYQWTGGIQNGVEFFPTQSGQYTVTGTNQFGCTDTAMSIVTVHPAPIADFKILNMVLSTSAPGTGFDNLSTGATTYVWDFGDGSPLSTEFEPYHEFPSAQAGTYEVTLTAYSDRGCPAQKIKYIYVTQDYTIYVPNAFTPDGSGLNEIFKPVMDGFDEDDYALYIFNRWGEIIFESHNMSVGWDGTYSQFNERVQDGVFIWKIIVGLKDSGDTKIFVGHVSLLK